MIHWEPSHLLSLCLPASSLPAPAPELVVFSVDGTAAVWHPVTESTPYLSGLELTWASEVWFFFPIFGIRYLHVALEAEEVYVIQASRDDFVDFADLLLNMFSNVFNKHRLILVSTQEVLDRYVQ